MGIKKQSCPSLEFLLSFIARDVAADAFDTFERRIDKFWEPVCLYCSCDAILLSPVKVYYIA